VGGPAPSGHAAKYTRAANLRPHHRMRHNMRYIILSAAITKIRTRCPPDSYAWTPQ
jgi:hypothetical protein